MVRTSKDVLLHFTSACVQILIGKDDDQVKFFVHKDLITLRSDFFARALTGPWKEAEDDVVNLPEDDSDIFGLYLHLLYTGKLPIEETIKHSEGDGAHGDKSTDGNNSKSNGSNNDGSQKKLNTIRDSKFWNELDRASGAEFSKLAKLYVLSEKLQDRLAKMPSWMLSSK